MPKYSIGDRLVQCGGVAVCVLALCGSPFGEPCYWVSDGLSKWVCTESLLEKEVVMNIPLCGEAEALRRLDPESMADAFWSFDVEREAEAIFLEERGESEVRDEWFA